RPLTRNEREVMAWFVPADPIVTLRVSDAWPGLVPHFELAGVTQDGTVNDGLGRLPGFGGPEHGIAGEFTRLLHHTLHPGHRRDQLIVQKQLLLQIQRDRSRAGRDSAREGKSAQEDSAAGVPPALPRPLPAGRRQHYVAHRP